MNLAILVKLLALAGLNYTIVVPGVLPRLGSQHSPIERRQACGLSATVDWLRLRVIILSLALALFVVTLVFLGTMPICKE